jgi:hypothetical protein
MQANAQATDRPRDSGWLARTGPARYARVCVFAPGVCACRRAWTACLLPDRTALCSACGKQRGAGPNAPLVLRTSRTRWRNVLPHGAARMHACIHHHASIRAQEQAALSHRTDAQPMPFIGPGPRAHERARRCTVCVRAMRARIVPERGVKDELDRCAEGAADGELGGGGGTVSPSTRLTALICAPRSSNVSMFLCCRDSAAQSQR